MGYWATMTMTSIGYGDVLPLTPLEYCVCILCMVGSSLIWAYIVGALCAIMSTMDPEQADFEQRLDAFNMMADEQGIPTKIRYRAREYIREARRHEKFVRSRNVAQNLG